MRNASAFFAVALVCALLPMSAEAERGFLVLHVADVDGRAIRNVQISTKGDGSIGNPTDVAGRTRIRLAVSTQPQAIVALTIVRAPKDFVFISPWDSQIRVPPFENETQNFASVVLVERGDRIALENRLVIVSLVSRLNVAKGARDAREPSPQRQRDVLEQTAKMFGVEPWELDAAILAWGERTHDQYEKGLAALYAENFSDATSNLTAALKAREERLDREKRDVADAAFFLGQALYRQGKYAKSADAYRKALGYRPGDPITTNNLALSLLQLGDYAQAEPLLHLAVGAIEIAKGENDPDLAYPLNNSGALAVMKGDLAAAEAAFRRGLAIRKNSFGENDARTAYSLANVASVLLLKGDDAGAEPLLVTARRVLEEAPSPCTGPECVSTIPLDRASSRSFGPASPTITVPTDAGPAESKAVGVGGGRLGRPGVASVMLNQATLALHWNHLEEAQGIAKKALESEKKALGPRDPEIANALQVLGQIDLALQSYAAAGRCFAQALEILQAAFGDSHPALVDALAGAGDAAASQRMQMQAAAAYRRAIEIRKRSFGPTDTVAARLSAKLMALAS